MKGICKYEKYLGDHNVNKSIILFNTLSNCCSVVEKSINYFSTFENKNLPENMPPTGLIAINKKDF